MSSKDYTTLTPGSAKVNRPWPVIQGGKTAPPPPPPRPTVTLILPNGRTLCRELPPKKGPYPIVCEQFGPPKGLTESFRRAMWNGVEHCYVERPANLVRAELKDRFTPRQINSTRVALGVLSELRGGCRWWIPMQCWPHPKPLPRSGMVWALHPDGELGIWPRHDLEHPHGYAYR